MNRVYLYNLPANNIQFSLYGKGGNEVVYKFTNGNITLNQPAYFMTSDPYFQMVLEDSQLFKDGSISFDKETAKNVATEKAVQKAKENARKAEEALATIEKDDTNEAEELTTVADVKSVTQAINYVQEHFGEVARTAAQARSIAEKNGVSFPNLKVSTKVSKD